MFRSILVPLDGSPLAEQALPWADRIAQKCGSEVCLVTGHRLYAFENYSSAWAPFDAAQDALFRQSEERYLELVAVEKLKFGRERVKTKVTNGLPADAILAGARDVHPELIVMTTHGYGPLSRAFLGSVADEVVRRSEIPVLLIRPTDETPALEPCVRSILVPLDGSPFAEQIIPTVRELASRLGASCHLCSVVPASSGQAFGGAIDDSQLQQAQQRDADQARAYLAGIAGQLREHSIEVTTKVVVGQYPAEAVTAEAANAKCGLIALATHGRSGFKRLVLGSVADKVIRTASTPVLVLPGRQPT